MAQHFHETCYNFENTILQTMKGSHVQLHSFLSWTGSSLPVHTDWCVYTHNSIVSHHLGKISSHSDLPANKNKSKCQDLKTRNKQRICARLAPRAGNCVWWWCLGCPAQILYNANMLCLYTISEAYWKKWECVYTDLSGENIHLLPKGFLSKQPERIQHRQLLCMFISTYWETSQGERLQKQEPIWSSIRNELLMLAGMTQ